MSKCSPPEGSNMRFRYIPVISGSEMDGVAVDVSIDLNAAIHDERII